MQPIARTLCTAVLLSLVSLPTHASDAAAPGALAPKQLPKLVLHWECGKCEQNAKVLPLIEQGYAAQAAAAGYTISDSETADVAIIEFRQRKPGMRVMFGVMAGKDKLTTRVRFRGADLVAKDDAANVFEGMNSLCAAVSKQVARQLLTSVQTP